MCGGDPGRRRSLATTRAAPLRWASMTDAPPRPSRAPPAGGAPSPRVPFDRWPVQAFEPAFGFLWYTSPAVLVSQAAVPHIPLAAVRVVQDHIDLALAHRATDNAAHGGLLILHDWRMVTGYDRDARLEFFARMRGRPRSYMRHAITCVALSPILRMAVEAGNLAATLVSGAKSEVGSDPAPILREHKVAAPLVGARFPGREAG